MQKREGVNTPSLPHSDGPGKTVLEAVSSVRATWGTCFLPLQSPAASPFHPGREKKQANGRGAGASRTRTETVASGKRWGRGSKRHLRETRGHSRSHRAGGAGRAQPQPQGQGRTPSATGPGGTHPQPQDRVGGAHPQPQGRGARTSSAAGPGGAHPQPQGQGGPQGWGERTASATGPGGAHPQSQGPGGAHSLTLSHGARGSAHPQPQGWGRGAHPQPQGRGQTDFVWRVTEGSPSWKRPAGITVHSGEDTGSP